MRADLSAGSHILGRVMDPRKAGGVYRSGYWQRQYTVDAVTEHNGVRWFSVTWEDGTTGQHCTAWDVRDSIVSQPAPKA